MLDSSWKAQCARSYFDFHAAPDAGGVSPETHGVFPVWGFGDIVASNHPVARVGERVYGYFAPARYLGKCLPSTPAERLPEYFISPGVFRERLE